MQQYKLIFMYGFAIFAMFFGSGNLVFPLQIGFAAGSSWVIGFVGLLLTGIMLPLMGLFVIKIHRGNYLSFFAEAGKFAGVLLPLFMLSLLGSFGIVPRCITVAFGSINYLFPQITLIPFSLFFCVLTFFFCLDDRIMIKILGKWLSPTLLISLIILIVVAVIKAPTSIEPIAKHIAFKDGFLTGYQTMDLFAAFFFSSLIFTQIQQIMPNSSTKEIVLFAIKPSIIGAFLLASIYFGFVFLGSHYSSLINTVTPELMLPTIAKHTLGNLGTLVMAVAMFFSCLTTAVALNNLYARYLCSVFKIKKERFFAVLFLVTLVAFIVSLLNFKGIAAFLSPILEITYPGVIALTLMALCWRGHQGIKIKIFYLITAIICLCVLKY